MPTTIQIVLFVTSSAQANEVAQAVFPGVPITSSMTQDALSAAELAGDIGTKVSCQPGRIDFVWEPRPTGPVLNETEISLDALAAQLARIGEWVSTQPATRVAAVFTYRKKVASAAEALGCARAELAGVEIPDGATEFTYRLNVPSPVDGMGMNRIVTWQTSKIAFLGFTIGATTGPFDQVFHELWERTVDVNTLQEDRLSGGSAGEALQKVLEEARRLGELSLGAL